MSLTKSSSFLLAALFALGAAQPAKAVNAYWCGSASGSTVWGTKANWYDSKTPADANTGNIFFRKKEFK